MELWLGEPYLTRPVPCLPPHFCPLPAPCLPPDFSNRPLPSVLCPSSCPLASPPRPLPSVLCPCPLPAPWLLQPTPSLTSNDTTKTCLAPASQSNWLVFTAGCMGAGKGHTLQHLQVRT